MNMSLDGLPPEILMEMFRLLSMEDLCALSSVCKSLHPVADDDSLWQPFCHPSWRPDNSYKEAYMSWLRDVIKVYRKGVTNSKNLVIKQDYTIVKAVMLGNSGVGKTTLMTRWVDEEFYQNYISNIGIDFKYKTIQMESTTYKMQLWDTAGQERFRTITRAYFRGACAIMLLYDLTDMESVDKLKFWVDLARADDPYLPIVLVGSKADLVENNGEDSPTFLAAQDIAEELALPHILTSAKTVYNVNEAFNLLLQVVITSSIKGCALRLPIHAPLYIPSEETLAARGIRPPPLKAAPFVTTTHPDPPPPRVAYCC